MALAISQKTQKDENRIRSGDAIRRNGNSNRKCNSGNPERNRNHFR